MICSEYCFTHLYRKPKTLFKLPSILCTSISFNRTRHIGRENQTKHRKQIEIQAHMCRNICQIFSVIERFSQWLAVSSYYMLISYIVVLAKMLLKHEGHKKMIIWILIKRQCLIDVQLKTISSMGERFNIQTPCR